MLGSWDNANNFTKAQLDEPKIARSNAVLRNCVHCDFAQQHALHIKY